MKESDALFINNLIFTNLANYQSLKLPGIGVLRSTLLKAETDSESGSIRAPRYIVEYLADGETRNLVTLICEELNIDTLSGEILYNEWVESIVARDGDRTIYSFEKVGTLSITEGAPAIFSVNKELETILSPFGGEVITPSKEEDNDDAKEEIFVESIEPILETVEEEDSSKEESKEESLQEEEEGEEKEDAQKVEEEESIVKNDQTVDSADKEQKKGKKRLLIPIIITLFCIAILSIIFITNRKDRVSTPIIEEEIEVIEEPVVVEEINLPDTLPTRYVGFHIIAGSFEIKSNAENLVKKFEKDGYKPLFMELPHSVTPYFVSIAYYPTHKEVAKEFEKYVYDTDYWILEIK